MQNDGDSSILRSLAIALGDGIAFGVGMKLTRGASSQHAGRGADNASLASRVKEIERRLESPGRASAGAFDRRVMEAVVNALDARLKEHSGIVERQVTELEAGMTLELKSLHENGAAASSAYQQQLELIRRECDEQVSFIGARVDEQIEALREAQQCLPETIARLVEQHTGIRIDALSASIEANLGAQFQATLAAAVEQRLPGIVTPLVQPVVDQARAAAGQAEAKAAAAEARVAALCADLEARNQEIAALRQRLDVNDRRTTELLLVIGQACNLTAKRIAEPESPSSGGELPARGDEAARSNGGESPRQGPPAEAKSNGAGSLDPMVIETLSQPAEPPVFTRLGDQGVPWRVVASTFVIAASSALAGFLSLH